MRRLIGEGNPVNSPANTALTSSPDARLLDLVESAEREEPCPKLVNMLTGSWLIQGRPVSTAQFIQASHDELSRTCAATKEVRKTRGDREKAQLVQSKVRPIIGSIQRSRAYDGATLSLLDVTIVGSTGPSLHPPAIRVPLASVEAWWVVDFEVKNGGSSGGAVVGVGFAF